MQATEEMLMTVAPASAAVRTAMARVSTSPTPDFADRSRGETCCSTAGFPMMAASGARPPNDVPPRRALAAPMIGDHGAVTIAVLRASPTVT